MNHGAARLERAPAAAVGAQGQPAGAPQRNASQGKNGVGGEERGRQQRTLDLLMRATSFSRSSLSCARGYPTGESRGRGGGQNTLSSRSCARRTAHSAQTRTTVAACPNQVASVAHLELLPRGCSQSALQVGASELLQLCALRRVARSLASCAAPGALSALVKGGRALEHLAQKRHVARVARGPASPTAHSGRLQSRRARANILPRASNGSWTFVRHRSGAAAPQAADQSRRTNARLLARALCHGESHELSRWRGRVPGHCAPPRSAVRAGVRCQASRASSAARNGFAVRGRQQRRRTALFGRRVHVQVCGCVHCE